MTVTRYRPRPTPVQALQWTGDNAAAMTAFAAERFAEIAPADRTDPDSTAALLETDHDSWFDLHVGDWVVRRAGGWFGVIDDAEFRDQYETEDGGKEPVDRSAVLREGAAAIDHLRATMLAPPVADQYATGLTGAANELRRLADEAQQAEADRG